MHKKKCWLQRALLSGGQAGGYKHATRVNERPGTHAAHAEPAATSGRYSRNSVTLCPLPCNTLHL